MQLDNVRDTVLYTPYTKQRLNAKIVPFANALYNADAVIQKMTSTQIYDIVENGKSLFIVHADNELPVKQFTVYIYVVQNYRYADVGSAQRVLYRNNITKKLRVIPYACTYDLTDYEPMTTHVIGEFTCKARFPVQFTDADDFVTLTRTDVDGANENLLAETCLSLRDLRRSLEKTQGVGIALCISDLQIYKTPINLRDFRMTTNERAPYAFVGGGRAIPVYPLDAEFRNQLINNGVPMRSYNKNTATVRTLWEQEHGIVHTPANEKTQHVDDGVLKTTQQMKNNCNSVVRQRVENRIVKRKEQQTAVKMLLEEAFSINALGDSVQYAEDIAKYLCDNDVTIMR